MREELGSNAFLQLNMISRLYALLPTRANRMLDEYTRRFKEFNLRMVALAEEVRGHAKNPVTPVLSPSVSHRFCFSCILC